MQMLDMSVLSEQIDKYEKMTNEFFPQETQTKIWQAAGNMYITTRILGRWITAWPLTLRKMEKDGTLVKHLKKQIEIEAELESERLEREDFLTIMELMEMKGIPYDPLQQNIPSDDITNPEEYERFYEENRDQVT